MKMSLFLLLVIILGFFAQSRIIIMAGIFLLLFEELKIESILEFLSKHGIEIGLVFLLLAILSSLVLNPLGFEQLKLSLISRKGIVAVTAGMLATRFNGMGLDLLQNNPQLIVGIIIGSLLGIFLIGGVPVGPLTAAGLAALFIEILSMII